MTAPDVLAPLTAAFNAVAAFLTAHPTVEALVLAAVVLAVAVWMDDTDGPQRGDPRCTVTASPGCAPQSAAPGGCRASRTRTPGAVNSSGDR